MQFSPQPPKSYSLIKNLLPSASLDGQTSQPDNQQHQTQYNPQLTAEVNQFIQTIQQAPIQDLKTALQQELQELQKLTLLNNRKISPQQLLNIPQQENPIIIRLKQLKLISDIMVERMNEKYTESRTRYEQFKKVIDERNRVLKMKSNQYWKGVEKKVVGENQKIQKNQKNYKNQKNHKVEESQSRMTEKKSYEIGQEKRELVLENNLKKTKKQQDKEQMVKIKSK